MSISPYISKVIISNFKCFGEKFELHLKTGTNILVGNNEAGKSTILQGIHLAITGMLNGRNLKTDLSQSLFNNDAIARYFTAVNNGTFWPLPEIKIELFLTGDSLGHLTGDGNSERTIASGIGFQICFDEKYTPDYTELVKNKSFASLPIEYYEIRWQTFGRQEITPKMLGLKAAMIDSTASRTQNGSDLYIGRIVKDCLSDEEVIEVSQAHRTMQDSFSRDDAIVKLNLKLGAIPTVSGKSIKLAVDMPNRNAWSDDLVAILDGVPFHNIGKGEQCIIKTKLALSHKKAVEANFLLLEEPENHLSHSKLNQLLNEIINSTNEKQVIITSHSSYVANKLGLDRLILINSQSVMTLGSLPSQTSSFFKKLAGYETLRLLLADKVILVEGDSDELIVQKAYMTKNRGRLPIEDGIDVISVGTSALRFLEVAEKLRKPTKVVTDNDGDVQGLRKKYKDYLPPNAKDGISICFEPTERTGLLIKGNGKPFNYNTLEPCLLSVNNLQRLNSVFQRECSTEDEMNLFMNANKTDCALKIFDSAVEIQFPQYILDSIG